MKKLKVVVLLVAMGLGLFSCEKVCSSTCGMIVSDNVADYSVVIRNDCSGNDKVFYLSEGDWMNAHPGSNYCISNTSNW